MKKTRLFICMILVALSAMFAIVGCTTEEGEKTLESLTVTTNPTKVVYEEGEKFDKTGMVVTASFSDQTKNAVTDYTVSPSGGLKTSDTKIIVSYTYEGVTKTAEVVVTVNVKKILESVKVATQPSKTTYYAGEVFDASGMKIVAKYSDGTDKEVLDYDYPKTALEEGTTKVTITYQGKTAEVAVTVLAKGKTTKFEAEDERVKRMGGAINTDAGSGGKNVGGLNNEATLTFWLDSDAEEVVRLAVAISSEQAGGGNLTKTFDKLFSFTLNDSVVDTSSLVVAPVSDSAKTSGDYNDFREVLINVTLVKGHNKLVFASATDENGEYHGTNFDYIAVTSITSVDWSPAPTLSSITVSGAKTDYFANQNFSTEGMVVTAKYSYGEDKIVTGYSVTPEVLFAGTTDVIVSYAENGVTVTAEVSVTVSEKSVTAISVAGEYKTEYYEYDTFDPTGMIVTFVYNDGSEATAKSEEYSFDKSPFSAGTTAFRVYYSSTIYQDIAITVKAYTGNTVEFAHKNNAVSDVNDSSPMKDFALKYGYVGGMNNEGKALAYEINSSAAQKVMLTLVLAGNEGGDTKLNEMYSVFVNDTEVIVNDGVIVENKGKIAYTYFTSVQLVISLTGGKNEIKVVSKGGPATNFSGLIIKTADANLAVEKYVEPAIEYKGNSITIVTPGASKGGEINESSPAKAFVEEHGYRGGVPEAGDLNFNFASSVKQKVQIKMYLAGNEAGDTALKNMFYIKINGTDIAETISAVVSNPDKIAYYYFVEVIFEVEVRDGNNVLTFTSNGGSGTNFSGIVITTATTETSVTAA